MKAMDDVKSTYRTINSTETKIYEASKPAGKMAKKAWSFVPVTMTEGEFTAYCVIIAIVIIALCVVCWIIKKILIFAIVIALFCAAVFWYVFIYRN